MQLSLVKSKASIYVLTAPSRNLESSNELRDGYNWHEAYYLYPIGISDIRTASADRDINNSNIYQNINWPTTAGGHAEK